MAKISSRAPSRISRLPSTRSFAFTPPPPTPSPKLLQLDFGYGLKPILVFMDLERSRHFDEFLKRCHDVPGFVMPESIAIWDCLLAFQQHRQISGPVLEIGVYYGKSAVMLAMYASEADELFLVDPSDFVDAAEVLVKTFKPTGVVVLKQKSSHGAVWSLAGSHAHHFRWVHVDGDHKAESVWKDLELGNRLLADEGILCVDDFLNPRYPQLIYAVCTFLEKHRAELQMFLCGFNKAYLVRPNALFRHLQFVKEDLGPQLASVGVKEITIYKTDYPSVLNCFGIGSRWGDFLYYGLDEDPTQVLI
jgi:predicted O-methyltransferase YrrM